MLKFRMVAADEWSVSECLSDRVPRLIDVPSPCDLLQKVFAESDANVEEIADRMCWQESSECPGFFRIVAQITLSETVFDQLINGRSGYRAQYYLSPEEGVLFNRSLIDGLIEPIREAFRLKPLAVGFDSIETSLKSPHSKVWVFRDPEAFDEAAANALNPKRWVQRSASRGRKAPLPMHTSIDLKGSFIDPSSGEIFVDELKLDRPFDLFEKGYT